MSQLKPYSKYKKSGVDWLGDIPEGWNALRIGSMFLERREKVSDKDFKPLSVTKNGIVPQLENAAKSNDGDNRKGVRAGDFVINSRSDRKGSSGIAYEDGSVSLINIAMQPKGIVSKYSEYLLKGYNFIEEFYRYGHGIVADLWTTRYSDMKGMLIPVPSKVEQTTIVKFLDGKTQEVQDFIALKENTIALLKERKTALINQAVTQGLDPKIEMKDSGVEWLGQVPEQWSVSSVKRLATLGRKKFTDGDWIEAPFITNDGVRLIQTGNVGQGVYKEKGYRYINEKTFRNFNCTELLPGDILICRLDGPVGRACLVPDLGVKMITSVDNAILKVSENVFSKYVVYLMTSSLWLDWIQSMCRAGGGFRFRISRSKLGGLLIPLPPFDEQKDISLFLDDINKEIDQSIAQAEKEITLIKEYQQRLISDAVTGKIDVREYK